MLAAGCSLLVTEHSAQFHWFFLDQPRRHRRELRHIRMRQEHCSKIGIHIARVGAQVDVPVIFAAMRASSFSPLAGQRAIYAPVRAELPM